MDTHLCHAKMLAEVIALETQTNLHPFLVSISPLMAFLYTILTHLQVLKEKFIYHINKVLTCLQQGPV